MRAFREATSKNLGLLFGDWTAVSG